MGNKTSPLTDHELLGEHLNDEEAHPAAFEAHDALGSGGINEFLNSAEVAEVLGVSQRMVQLMAADGTLPHIRVGRALRFPKGELHARITELTRE